jgi:hypothetical protein
MRSRLAPLVVAAALVASSAACADRQHLRAAHGSSYHEAFARQRANPQAGRSDKAVAGLDSQDAEVVAQTYRAGMAPKSDASAAASSRSVFIVPTNPNPTGYTPPPSVPAP